MRPLLALWIACCIALPRSDTLAEESGLSRYLPGKDVPRTSLFYFEDELNDSATRVASSYHASAIQFPANGQASVWINGIELKVNETLGQIQIARIEPSAATLRIAYGQDEGKTIRLGMNQTVTVETLIVHEGNRPLNLRQDLARTRLP